MNNKTSYIYKKRRIFFTDSLPEDTLAIIPNKNLSIRSNDVEYKFKPDPDFFYLTGFEEPHSICIIKKEKKHSSYILFVEEKNKEKEIWTGKRNGTEGAKKIYLADEAFPIEEFNNKLKSLIDGCKYVYYPLGKNTKLDSEITQIVNSLRQGNRLGKKAPSTISDPREIIHKMRLIKDNFEIDCIQKACDISTNAHLLAMSYAKPGMYEYELEALIEYKFRASGSNGTAYPSIVGSGKNCTILHYINNDKKIKKNDLILIDAGCEYNFYASDLTRTFPIDKKFSGPQKDIYEIVLESQLKAIDEVRPGKTFKHSFDKAVSVIVDGLKELRLLKGSKSEIIKKKKYRRYFMHNIGHWLGLDVHDAGPYHKDQKNKKIESIKLAPGIVMTVEPGIYIPNETDIPKHFRGIGIRIEDDVLVTKNGNKVLTEKAPKKVKEIEDIRSRMSLT